MKHWGWAVVLGAGATLTFASNLGGHRYQLILRRLPAAAPSTGPQPVRLTLTVHTGDHCEPVATVVHQDHRRWWQRHHPAAALGARALLCATVIGVLLFAC